MRKTKTQISFAVTSKLISAFVFASRIVQSLYFLNPKFQASSHLLWLYSLVCVGPGPKPRKTVFSQRGSYNSGVSRGLNYMDSKYDELYAPINISPQRGGGGSSDTLGIRQQNNPNPQELDRTPRHGMGKLDTFSRSSKLNPSGG